MKFRLQIVLMVLTILGITAFLLVWLKQTYEQEKKTLAIKTEFSFRDVIQQLQVSNLELDTVKGIAAKFKNLKLIKKEFNEELSADINEKRAIISTINIIGKKAGDTSSFVKAILVAKDSSGIMSRNNVLKKTTPATPEKNHLIRVLYGVDSLQDSLKIDEINRAFSKSLLQQNISVPFTIMKVDSIHKPGEPDIVVTVGLAHPVAYFLRQGNRLPYLLKQIAFPILSSILLLAFTIISFWLLYRNLIRQQKLTEIKNEFIGNITHELKTPIATVAVAIEAMRNFDALQNPGRTQEYLDISANELQRLSLLVDKVLSLSKFEKKEIEIKRAKIDLLEMVREVIGSMKLQFEKQLVSISLQPTGTNFIIEADRRHISSVIYNLLDNALKYSTADPEINVQVISEDDFLELRVSDNGIGIPAEYNRKIFEQFFRVPGGDTHNIKGYGLGLSYVNYIVKAHHGSIEVKSEPGKGSSFNVKLPVKNTEL